MENNKKKTIIISSIIAVILVIIVVLLTIKLIKIKKESKTSGTVNENVTTENIFNNIVENDLNEQEDDLEDNENSLNQTISNEETAQNKPIVDPEQEVDKETIQKQENNQEKAIGIAKKDWGEDNSVYFYYEGINNEKHVVSVRKVDTTRTVRYYYINISTGNFEIEE